MKKLVSILLCIVLAVSVLSVSAFAANIYHSKGDTGYTNQATTASWKNYNNQWTTHYFPANSTFTLIADLYYGDTSAKVSLFDTVNHYRIESCTVSSSVLEFY